MCIFGMVTTQDSFDYTCLAIESFFKTTTLTDNDKFILIDNDHSVQIDSIPYKENIELICNKTPLGFAANANQCIETALNLNQDLYFLNNDIIFTKDWYKILKEAPYDTICTPLSNREVEYVSSVSNVGTNKIISALHCKPPPLSVENYTSKESQLASIAEAHKEAFSDLIQTVHLPFFCIKLPIHVLKTVGKLDEEYGQAGGEDFDYCLRCHLSNCKVAFAASSFMLHFGGKSTYASKSEMSQQQKREDHFKALFLNKWGEELFKLLMEEDSTALINSAELKNELDSGNIKAAVQRLLGDKQVKLYH